MVSIWLSGDEKTILMVEMNLEFFCREWSLELFEGVEDGLGKFLACYTYEFNDFPIVFTKYIESIYPCVYVNIDSSCKNIEEWENTIIEKYLKNYKIDFRLSKNST
ncbi:hypothetical protein [Acinetobacter gyllenbergii]|uniref:hypothetical protein n=1 Tax=Acinetobacter gyllenbergii TaxID=134534 RepID=UPI003F56B887